MNAAPSMTVSAGRDPRATRRGVLMLVVLSMLTLFLMLGAAYLVTATRAREAARAYARLTLGGDDARVPYARLLDTVLLRVVRGGAAPTAPSGPAVSFESLLADKFGSTTTSGTAVGFSPVFVGGVNAAVLTGTLLTSGSMRPTDLNGRLITLCEPGRPVTTHRIIQAKAVGTPSNSPATQFAVAVDMPWRAAPSAGAKSTTRAIINGREFDGSSVNEAWDGFDATNPYLAWMQPGPTISTSVVPRISFCQPSPTLSGTYDYDADLVPDAADNDNDGVYDGVFLDFGLPNASDMNGNVVNLRASVLIVDLDGRFNVNAHDSLPRLIYAGTTNWPTIVSQTVPMGSGYGPAEVNGLSGTRCWTSGSAWTSGTVLFAGPPSGAPLQAGTTFATSENPTLFTLTGGPNARMIGVRSGSSRFSAGQSTPDIPGVEGRWGERAPANWSNIVVNNLAAPSSSSFSVPGQPAVDDEASRVTDRRAPLTQPSTVSYGVPPVWWTGTTFNWGVSPSVSGSTQPLPRGTFNSPPDLHGRMRTLTGPATAIAPQLMFAKAEWAGTTAGASRETTDDPYELRLDTRRGFGGLLFDPTAGGSGTSTSSVLRDNPFTAAELEPVLRPYDADANRVASRLPAMLGSVGEEARLKITTDSWDTTAVVGAAASQIIGWLASATAGNLYGSSATAGIIGGEIARGERFDLNRPLAASDGSNNGYVAGEPYNLHRQSFCKDLYTLLMALNNSASAAQLAQWAANVAEFRDGDSRVTPFEYDANPSNGWDVDGDVTTADGGSDRGVCWGAERPEIVIQEVFAWRNSKTNFSGMSLSLHRPWKATAYGSGANAIDAEPCDVAFDTLTNGTGSPRNMVNLGQIPGTDLYSGSNAGFTDVSGARYPIWRLRIVSGTTSYVRFDTATATAPGEIVDSTVTSGTLKPALGPDSSITFVSGASITTGDPVIATGTVTIAPSPPSRTLSTLQLNAGSVSVFLERLSDPTVVLTPAGTVPGTSITGSAVWYADPESLEQSGTGTWPVQYVVVDKCTVNVNDTSGATALAATTFTRPRGALFWRSSLVGNAASAPNGGTLSVPTPLPSGSGTTAWLPWPNRPFVSAAELTLVPQGRAQEILANYQSLVPGLSGAIGLGRGIPVSLPLLFDAVHVPTRFAGIHRTVTQDLSAATGIFNAVTTVNQLSSFREPGRVNLNTVTSDDVWNAVVAGQLPSPIQPRSTAGLASTPAENMFALLSGTGGTGSVVISDTSSPQLAVNLNPLHGIYTATRLANTVTPRSNVFAIWITLRESVANDPDSVRYRRALYIVDRSVPVGFEAGIDHNVWDCVRLRRIVE